MTLVELADHPLHDAYARPCDARAELTLRHVGTAWCGDCWKVVDLADHRPHERGYPPLGTPWCRICGHTARPCEHAQHRQRDGDSQ